jgi:citrate synthase
VQRFQEEMHRRGTIPDDVEATIKAFPKSMHPMTQFSMGMMALQPESKFVKAYNEGMHKKNHWVYTLEDALDVCAKVSRVAAIVYYNCYKPVSCLSLTFVERDCS